MIKVAITAPMGAGKSYCCKIFEEIGVPIFYTDNESRRIINENKELIEKVIMEFGNIYTENGINTEALRNIVFIPGGESKLKKLNEIVHPYVIEEYYKFCEKNKNIDYTISETALLYECNLQTIVDKVIYVHSDEENRIKRTYKRSGYSKEEYKQRMKSQIDLELKKSMADFIIYNDDIDEKNLRRQIYEIDRILKSRLL